MAREPSRGGLAVLNPIPLDDWERQDLGERLQTANSQLKKLYAERRELQRRVAELERLLELSG